MKDILAHDLQPYAVLIQAGATVVLVVITVYYAFVTNKILHAPYCAFLELIHFRDSDNGYTINNEGPAVAKKIKVKIMVLKKNGIIPYYKKYSHKGELNPRKDPSYDKSLSSIVSNIGEGYLLYNNPTFIIKYKIISGKTQKVAWLFERKEYRFEQRSFLWSCILSRFIQGLTPIIILFKKRDSYWK